MSTSFHATISRAFRVRGEGLRQVYFQARRAGNLLHDSARRAAYRQLPAAPFSIPRRDGYVVVPPGRFDETPGIVGDARAALAAFDAAAPPGGKNRKRFLVNVRDAATLTLESPVMRFALRDDVLAAVSRYLGLVPFLSTISVFHSDTVPGDPTSSQLHHCDGDDVTQVKIFVYCSDVDPPSGPLTVLDADSSARVRKAVNYQFRQRLTDEQVADVLGPGADRPILGPSGTTAFLDTSRCFHYGSRVAPDAPARLVTMIQYQTPYSFMLPRAERASLPFRRLTTASLPRLQRLVLGE
jgi:hypothetical protein